jgi:hypothetical protein
MTLTLERRSDLPNSDAMVVACGFSNHGDVSLPAARKQLLDLEVHDMGTWRLRVGRRDDLVEQGKEVSVHFESVGAPSPGPVTRVQLEPPMPNKVCAKVACR